MTRVTRCAAYQHHASLSACLHLLRRAAAALESSAVDLELVAVLAHHAALARDALVLADAIDAEAEALVAVLDRLVHS
jgi:hypothetical protein